MQQIAVNGAHGGPSYPHLQHACANVHRAVDTHTRTHTHTYERARLLAHPPAFMPAYTAATPLAPACLYARMSFSGMLSAILSDMSSASCTAEHVEVENGQCFERAADGAANVGHEEACHP